MPDNQRDKWDTRYRSGHGVDSRPAAVLVEHLHLLPAHGRALDLACGTGANAIELARAGLQVEARDISGVALEILARQATLAGVVVDTVRQDVLADPLPAAAYDVIVICRFLERSITAGIISALRPGGLLFYQTWTVDKPPEIGPANPDYLLQRNELLQLFNGLAIVVYREESTVGDLARGHRNEAILIAQKR